MPLKTPGFWYRDKSAVGLLLAPFGPLYGLAAARRMQSGEVYRSSLPVICVGNFTAGGGGKTPTAIAVAKLLKAQGERPAFLTRGYGGKAKGPVFVKEGEDAELFGDEALLLAAHAPTVVSADRVAGAQAIEATDATIVVMDDGFQNPSLHKDLALIVVDAAAGLGNGRVLPAGPLRAPLDVQLSRADALLVIGDGNRAEPLARQFTAAHKPVLKAKIAPDCDSRWLAILPVIGFAGIARPGKFFATLRNNGARLIDAHSYADHHRYSAAQAAKLLAEARQHNAMLVTTEKDWVRLPDDGAELGELKHRSRPFPIVVQFESEDALRTLLAEALSRRDASRGSA